MCQVHSNGNEKELGPFRTEGMVIHMRLVLTSSTISKSKVKASVVQNSARRFQQKSEPRLRL